MSGATKRQRLRIEGMHCASCAMAIDLDLEDVAGVEEARTNYARAETQVAFDPASVNLEAIIDVIRRAGYDAQPVP
ncbi:MAG: cation transporter [Chloroflexota bacterium]|nr:cation transporter [Chloroflexota bacterium]